MLLRYDEGHEGAGTTTTHYVGCAQRGAGRADVQVRRLILVDFRLRVTRYWGRQTPLAGGGLKIPTCSELPLATTTGS